MEEKTLLLHENVCFQMLDFVTSKSNSEVAKSNSNTFVENHFFLINYIKWGSRFSQCFILLTALHYLLPSNVYMLTIILRKVSNAFKAVCGIADWYNRNQCWYHHDSALVLHISLGKWHAFKLLQRADSTNPYAVNNYLENHYKQIVSVNKWWTLYILISWQKCSQQQTDVCNFVRHGQILCSTKLGTCLQYVF